MTFNYYDLANCQASIQQIINANNSSGVKRTSFSRIFKAVRRNPKFVLFGDYPILSFVLDEMVKLGSKITQDQIKLALSYSDEYRENLKRDKMIWYRLLEEQINHVNAPLKFSGSRLNQKSKSLRKSKRYVGTTKTKQTRKKAK